MKNLLLIFLLAAIFACRDKAVDPEAHLRASACGVANPIEDLPWLKDMLEKSDENTLYCTPRAVSQGNYQGQTVYIVSVGGALCCDCGSVVYNCSGDAVFSCSFGEQQKIRDTKVIWKKG